MNTIDPAEISIRSTLLPGDLGFIAYLHGLLYAGECGYGLSFEAYVLDGLKDLARKYDAARDRVWICEHRQQIVGFLVAQHRDDALQLRYFLLRPAYRGCGLGKRLMEEFISFMNAGNYRHAFLWTTNEQHAAIALYTRYGFRLTDEKASEDFGKPLTERRYDLSLA